MRKISINSQIDNGIIVGRFPLVTVKRNGETRKELDHGAAGSLFEMVIANIANPKDKRQTVQAQGKADVKHRYNYEIKQGSSTIKYGDKDFIFGSSRVIYSPHIFYKVLEIVNNIATIQIDIKEQNIYCVSKKDFLNIINELNLKKANKSRNTININTIWRNTTNEPHSKKMYKKFNELLNEYNIINDELLNKVKSF